MGEMFAEFESALLAADAVWAREHGFPLADPARLGFLASSVWEEIVGPLASSAGCHNAIQGGI